MFKPKTVSEAKQHHEFWHQVRMKNIHFSGWSLITLIFAIGGCVFTFNLANQSVSKHALGLGGAALFLQGLSMQIDRTSDDMINDLIDVISKEK